MSAAERHAWQALRTLRADGIHIVRQLQIGRYIVDFAIRRSRIAIEIDGGVHDLPGRPEYDAERQAHLEGKGWRFVRIRAEAPRDADFVLKAVRAALTPSPSRGGGRGWGEAPTPEQISESAKAEPGSASIGASPHPLTPSSQEEGEASSFPPGLQRRTREHRKLPSRAKS